MSGLSLYDRAREMDDALEILEAAESEEERELALAKVNEVAGELLAKVDRFGNYLASLEAVEDFAAAEIKRLETRKKQAARRRECLMAYAIRIMQERGWEEMQGETSCLKLRFNPPSVIITSELEVPAEFTITTQTTALDKTRIKVALKQGREVPGARLEQKLSLRRA